MLLRFFLAFTIIPMLELYLLVQIGTRIGALTTIAIVVFTGMAGAWLARQQGMGLVMRIREQLNKGVMPTSELLDGACILVAAVLLVTPGFMTDIVGISLLLPFTRTLLKTALVRAFERAVQRGQVHVINPQGFPPHGGPHGPTGPGGPAGPSGRGPRKESPGDDVIDVCSSRATPSIPPCHFPSVHDASGGARPPPRLHRPSLPRPLHLGMTRLPMPRWM